jgi:hypothetical protein
MLRKGEASTESKDPYFVPAVGVLIGILRLRRRPLIADGNFAQDDSFEYALSIREETEVDFQVNGETYFLSLADDERRWLVLLESDTGTRDIPVYVDEAEVEDLKIIVEDKKRRQILN